MKGKDVLHYIRVMRPVITVPDSELRNNTNLRERLQQLGRQTEIKGAFEYIPKARKATEVIRVLRESGVEYQIRFDLGQ